MKSDGTAARNITGGSLAADTAPAWSLDGHKIAFTSNRTGTKQIFVQDLAELGSGGPAPVQITSVGRNQDPTWGVAAGVERIYFTSNRDGDDEIFWAPPQGGVATQLTSNEVPDRRPRWSKSGELYYQSKQGGGDFEVWWMSPNGGRKVPVTDNGVADTDPAGSPDGELVAYISKDGADRDLFVANVDGSAAQRLTVNDAIDASPDWHALQRQVNAFPVYDVHVVPRGTEVEVSFKTSKPVTSPTVELWQGAALGGFQIGSGSGQNWSITVSFLDPATTYELEIVGSRPGAYTYYSHPTPVTTLQRKVTVTARYAFVWNDSDPNSCGEILLNLWAPSVPTASSATPEQEVCSGQTWNFANRTITLDGVSEDTPTIAFEAWDDDRPVGGYEVAGGEAELELFDHPETFTRTATVSVDRPDPEWSGDLDLEVTFDYSVEYHP